MERYNRTPHFTREAELMRTAGSLILLLLALKLQSQALVQPYVSIYPR
jgi:hypothetical protein